MAHPQTPQAIGKAQDGTHEKPVDEQERHAYDQNHEGQRAPETLAPYRSRFGADIPGVLENHKSPGGLSIHVERDGLIEPLHIIVVAKRTGILARLDGLLYRSGRK